MNNYHPIAKPNFNRNMTRIMINTRTWQRSPNIITTVHVRLIPVKPTHQLRRSFGIKLDRINPHRVIKQGRGTLYISISHVILIMKGRTRQPNLTAIPLLTPKVNGQMNQIRTILPYRIKRRIIMINSMRGRNHTRILRITRALNFLNNLFNLHGSKRRSNHRSHSSNGRRRGLGRDGHFSRRLPEM